MDSIRDGFVGMLLVAVLGMAASGQLQAQPLRQTPDLIRAHGQGLLPVGTVDLTATERLTAARTIALVDALGELAALTRGTAFLPTHQTPAGARLESQSDVQLGGVLAVSRYVVMQGARLEKWETVVSWSERPEVGTPGRIVIENWLLASPPVRRLDLYTLLRKVQEAGIAIEAWELPAVRRRR